MSGPGGRYLEFLRRRPRRDADEEIRAHIEMRVEDLVARGVAPEEARRRALEEFGDVEAIREETVTIDERMIRERRRSDYLSDVRRDVQVGWRSLRRSPGFTLAAVLCAAMGIGVTAAVISATYSILLRPLPYPDADRLVAVYAQHPQRDLHRVNISWPDYVSWRDGSRAFSALGMWTWDTETLSGDVGEAERIEGAAVTANLFPLMGVRPARGRGFLPEEETPGHERVVLLGWGLWQRRFGGDPSIVGKSVMLDARPYTVVGIMPPRFNFPDRGDLWVPFAPDPAGEQRGNRGYAGAIGRLAPGATLAAARADLDRIDSALEREFPDQNLGWRSELIPLRADLVGDLREPMLVFLAAVVLVLAMVCANVANLMLARGTSRERELAVRGALGASRGRLVRQLMTESFIIAALAGAIGGAIAWTGVALLRLTFPDGSPPFYISLALDRTALLVVAAVTLLTGVLFGVLPALRGARVQLAPTLRDAGRGVAAGLRGSRLRRSLVVGEIALSVVLLAGAALLVRSYRNLQGTDLGFDEDGILSARITLPEADYPTRAATAEFYGRLFERLRGMPGVVRVGAAQGIPFSGWNIHTNVHVEGTPPPEPGHELEMHAQFVTPDYFPAIGVPLLRGRGLEASDRDTVNAVALVNRQAVVHVFGGRDPLGQKLEVGGKGGISATVVGVIADFRHYRLPEPMDAAVYLPEAACACRQRDVVIRTTLPDAGSLAPALRAAIRDIDHDVAPYQIRTFQQVVSRSLWRQRLQGRVVGTFALLALVLAAIGLYGVISYAVAQRGPEFGLRMALGAPRRAVMWLVLEQSGRLVALGVGLGLLAALLAVRIIRALLYGIRATDPITFAAVALAIAAVALLASVIPAWRATRVAPVAAMRAD